MQVGTTNPKSCRVFLSLGEEALPLNSHPHSNFWGETKPSKPINQKERENQKATPSNAYWGEVAPLCLQGCALVRSCLTHYFPPPCFPFLLSFPKVCPHCQCFGPLPGCASPLPGTLLAEHHMLPKPYPRLSHCISFTVLLKMLWVEVRGLCGGCPPDPAM